MIRRITEWLKRVVGHLISWLKKWQVWAFVLLLLFIAVLVVFIRNTSFDWRPYDSSTQNVRNPTLWDFLELFIIPTFLVLGGFALDRVNRQRERERQKLEAEKNQKEVAHREKLKEDIERERYQRINLREFMDRIESLYTGKGEELFNINEPARVTARARIKHVLHQADMKRKQHVIDFLLDSSLALVTHGQDKKCSLLEGFSLEQTDFCGLKMRGIDLTHVNLKGAHFENSSDLSDACLLNANVSGTNFSETLLSDANLSRVHANVESNENRENQTFFSHSQMERCDLSHAELWNVQFDNVTLIEAKFHAAYLHKCTIAEESNLSNAIFGEENDAQKRTRIERTNFSNSNLSQVKFISCDIVNCTIDRCSLSQATFFNARLFDVNLCTSHIDGSVDFSNASLENVVLPTGNLSGISFKNAQLIGISFEDVDLTGADFAGAILQKVSFQSCNLAEADFTETYFGSMCSFEDTSLYKANFTKITVEDYICVDRDLECVKWHADELSSFTELGIKQRTQKDDIFDGLMIDETLSKYDFTNE